MANGSVTSGENFEMFRRNANGWVNTERTVCENNPLPAPRYPLAIATAPITTPETRNTRSGTRFRESPASPSPATMAVPSTAIGEETRR